MGKGIQLLEFEDDIMARREKRPQQERGGVRGWVLGFLLSGGHHLYYAYGHVPPYQHFAIYS